MSGSLLEGKGQILVCFHDLRFLGELTLLDPHTSIYMMIHKLCFQEFRFDDIKFLTISWFPKKNKKNKQTKNQVTYICHFRTQQRLSPF